MIKSLHPLSSEQFAPAPMLCRQLPGDGVGATLLASSPWTGSLNWENFLLLLPSSDALTRVCIWASIPSCSQNSLQSRAVGSSWLRGNGWKVRLKTHETKGFRTYKTASSWHKCGAAVGGIQREMGWVFQAWRKGKQSKTKQSWEKGCCFSQV